MSTEGTDRLFVAEAEAGYFTVLYDDDGPYAMGAEGTGNLFSMEVDETPDPEGHGAIYRPKKNT